MPNTADTKPSAVLAEANDPDPDPLADYDLSRPITANRGLRQGLPGYGDPHFALFLRKAFIKALGYSDDALSRPIVGIINTYSALNPCHANVPQLIEAAKRGVHLAGGLAVEFPTISVHESFASPTSMFLRNLMAMDTEEMIRCQPVDAVVAVGGCDKTVPAQIMGALSANKPVVPLVTGPMMPGSHRGRRVGACTDCRSNWAAYRAGEMDIEDISALNEELAPTGGTCGVMGTASTMACVTAALGLMPLLGATAPAVSSARLRIAEETGRIAAALAAGGGPRPQELLTAGSFHNALVVLQATGGSTNAVVHLLAIAGRHPGLAPGAVTLQTVDDIGRAVPLLVDLKPSGDNYLSDMHAAGGMPALLRQLRPLLRLGAATVDGRTLGEVLDATAPSANGQPYPVSTTSSSSSPGAAVIIRPLSDPLQPAGLAPLAVLRGNLAPGGAVIKASAVKDRRLLRHRGPAVVFSGAADLAARLDDESAAAEIGPDSVLVLRGIGPVGNPGMPEAGLVPIPRRLAARGVADMLRISDGRMSGTAGGAVVLHVSPEAALPESVLGVVRDGDVICCDVERRVLHLEVPEAEIQERLRLRAETLNRAPEGQGATKTPVRGYRGLYLRSVNQAQFGADFDFLTAAGC
ncbi:dihydroxy-acid dehydratase [Gaeumannomyces tritici R3-111a-1]|uniref:Dihydroxy-acid dehydratase n=1 Tax=Gaeumannomyces tritici (strain R3-111a-1) TaxID=644352 RepID=J3NPK1_GAET3|nr:dihydroxy-acid dehydratase [Gaeumannomyces tritici R3-111a-1]EJT78106.1 dihydroxy-acid dehydratase [Gaeumannomyces tritici R3-111a-1]